MKYLYATTAFLLASTPSTLADWQLRGGPGLIDGSPTGSVKYFGIRHEQHELRGVYSALEYGGWVDRAGGRRSSSAVLKAQIGVNPGAERGVYGKAFIGLAAISHTDSYLGGQGQFAQDFGVGFRDYYTNFEVAYSHFSSAGLAKPNKGRDFVLFSIGVRW